MNNQELQLVSEILKDVVAIGIIFASPYAFKLYKLAKEKAEKVIGEQNFIYIKSYIEGLVKAHPEMFNEQNIIATLESLNLKFGDKFTEDTIKRIVESIIGAINIAENK
jgi:hypothetical protein